MKNTALSLLILSLLLVTTPAKAQELVVNPETGEFRLIFVDLTEPVEEYFAEADHVGGQGRAVPFEASNPDWELPVLSLKTSRELQNAAENIRSGKDSKAGGLQSFGLKAVPMIANLLSDDKRIRKAVAQRAASLPGDNGSAFIVRLLRDPENELHQIGLKHLDRLSHATRLHLYHRLKGKSAIALITEEMKDRKFRQYFDKYNRKWDRDSSFKVLSNRKAPALIHQLYIEWLIDSDHVPTVKKSKQDPRTRKDKNKAFAKLIQGTKMTPNFKTIAKLRLGCEVKLASIERAGRDPDWHVRRRLCEVLATREDIKWRVPPVLLERQRDLCLDVRLAANKTLTDLHHLPHGLDEKRSHRFDSIQIAAWELWWHDRSKNAKSIERLWEETPVTLKSKRNIRIVWGDSPRVYDGLVGKHKILGQITFLDINKDGDVHDFGVDRVVLGNPEKILSIPLSRFLMKKNSQIMIDIDSRFGKLRAKKYRLRTWPVQIEGLFAKPYQAQGTIISSHADMNFAVREEITKLPVGFFNISGGWVLNKRSEVARITPPPGRGHIEISADKEVQKVVFGPRLQVTVEARLDTTDRKLQLRNVSITGAAGEVYKRFDPLLNSININVKAGNKKKDYKDWTARVVQYQSSMVGGLVPPLTDATALSFLGLVTLIEAASNNINLVLNPQKAQKELTRANLVAELNGVPAQLTVKRAEKIAKDAEVVLKKAEQTQKELELDTASDNLLAKQTELVSETGNRATIQGQLTAKQAELVVAQAAVPPDNNLIAQLTAEVASLTADLAAKDAQIATINGEIATLTAQIAVLQVALATLTTDILALETAITLLVAEITALETNTYQTQIALLDTQIAVIDAQIATDQATITAHEASLSVGAATAGTTLEAFKLALKLEPAFKAMAQSLGDKSWDPYEIDLKEFGDFGELDSLELTLTAPDLPFGKLKTTELLVPLK